MHTGLAQSVVNTSKAWWCGDDQRNTRFPNGFLTKRMHHFMAIRALNVFYYFAQQTSCLFAGVNSRARSLYLSIEKHVTISISLSLCLSLSSAPFQFNQDIRKSLGKLSNLNLILNTALIQFHKLAIVCFIG